MYISIYKYVQTGVICWAEEGPKCNVIPTINFALIFAVEWICWAEEGLKCNVMPTIIFFLFLWLNGSVNGLKPRICYIAIHFISKCYLDPR